MNAKFKFLLFVFIGSLRVNAQNLGIFTNKTDVGAVLHNGSVQYDKATDIYKLTGSGSNIWFKKDEFFYVYTRVKGDFILMARGHLIGAGKESHRKLGWMIRNSLDTSSAMASGAIHGDGLTSLQYRKAAGEDVQEMKSDNSQSDYLQLERRGDTIMMNGVRFGQTFSSTQIIQIPLANEVYVGLFVCAHNKNNLEQASFDNVRIVKPAPKSLTPYRQFLASYLEELDILSGKRLLRYVDQGSIQAPNFLPDGKMVIYNSQGLIYKMLLHKPVPAVLNTGSVKNNNNDHVLSFDGKMLGLSATSPDGKINSVVYTVPSAGGSPKQITPTGPSYLHGWSPDGKFLVFTGQRNGDFDIYRTPSGGGTEERLTTSPGLDDGPEYTPDGKYIYFNSVRSGLMQIWRMKSDGTEQEQITNDELNNWFPHISPDGKNIVFLSFMQDVAPSDHPFYKRVFIRVMPVSGGKPRVVAYVYGGQGTMNTPCWAPDSRHIVFVSNSEMNTHP